MCPARYVLSESRSSENKKHLQRGSNKNTITKIQKKDERTKSKSVEFRITCAETFIGYYELNNKIAATRILSGHIIRLIISIFSRFFLTYNRQGQL